MSPSSRRRGVAAPESKLCPACGLPFENRKKWASRGLWDSIVYCSERCRRAGRPTQGGEGGEGGEGGASGAGGAGGRGGPRRR